MQIKFDKLNRYETPTMTVCNPGSYLSNNMVTNAIGILHDTSDEELVLNFNATSSLSFRAYKVLRDDADSDAYTTAIYKSLQNRRNIYVEGIGFFAIEDVKETHSDEGDYKDITASSCEVEIQNKKMVYIEPGTYRFITNPEDSSDVGLLSVLSSYLPRWTIGAVDDALKSKYRTFDDIDYGQNMLSFMYDNMQEAYECIFVFDIVNRSINVYDKNTYISASNIHLTRDDLINNVDIEESGEEIYTALSVFGEDELTIASINPLGGSAIYRFDYYYDWMSPALQAKVEEWEAAVSGAKSGYYDLSLQLSVNKTSYYNLKSELSRLQIVADLYRRCKENIVAENSQTNVAGYNAAIASNGGDAIQASDEIAQTLANIAGLLAEAESDIVSTEYDVGVLEVAISEIEEQLDEIHNELSISSYFTAQEYAELEGYIFEGTYDDEYITITESMTESDIFAQEKQLFDRAETTLYRLSQPSRQFTVDMENFVFSSSFLHMTDELEVGSIVGVELDDDDVADLFLTSISINFEDAKLSMTFGDRYDRFDSQAIFEKTLGKIQKSANSVNYISQTIQPIRNGVLSSMQRDIENSRNVAKDAAISATDETVIIDDTGYSGRKKTDGGFDPEQVKITHNNIAFTDDAWETAKSVFGKFTYTNERGETVTTYGVNAESIVGNLIAGASLNIGGLTQIDNQIAELLAMISANTSSLSEVRGWIVFDSAHPERGLVIGQEDSPYTAQIINDRFALCYYGDPKMWITPDGGNMHTLNVIASEDNGGGRISFEKYDIKENVADGKLSIVYVGG